MQFGEETTFVSGEFQSLPCRVSFFLVRNDWQGALQCHKLNWGTLSPYKSGGHAQKRERDGPFV